MSNTSGVRLMITVDSAWQYSRYGLLGQQSTAEQLQEKQKSLCEQLTSNIHDDQKRKQIVKDLQEINSQLSCAQLEEQTAKLEAEQSQKNKEAAKKKRQRDRDLYGKHEENYIFNASISKLLSAEGKAATYSPLESAHRRLSRSKSTTVNETYSNARLEDKIRWKTDEIHSELKEAKEIALEEVQAVRKHKRKIIRELDKEEATKIPRAVDFPEPIGWIDPRYRRSRKRKVDVSI